MNAHILPVSYRCSSDMPVLYKLQHALLSVVNVNKQVLAFDRRA